MTGIEQSKINKLRLVYVSILLCMSFGLALTGWLLVVHNAAAVFRAFAAVGWGLAAVVFVRAAIVALNGTAWNVLLAGVAPAPLGACLLVRWIREAINSLLPVANIGGEIVGARLLLFWGVPGRFATASVLADLLLQAVGQAIFALVGAVLLMRVIGVWPAAEKIAAAAALAALALGGFYLVQRHGGARLFDKALAALAERWPSAGSAADLRLQEGFEAVWRNPGRVLATTIMHVIGWFFGTLEVLVALQLMGHPVTVEQGVILESMINAIRGAAFAIPSGLGVQEGGLVLLGHLLGLSPATSLALSFVKRVPDLALGLPGLLAWHWVEVRRLLHRHAKSASMQSPAFSLPGGEGGFSQSEKLGGAIFPSGSDLRSSPPSAPGRDEAATSPSSKREGV
jgi:glycosyltransferase 2 family protein